MHHVSQQQRLPCNVAVSRTHQRNRAALSAVLTSTILVVVPVSSLVATIIDAWGEVVAEVSAPDEAHIAANTPQGCTALVCRAPLNADWDADAAQWVSRGDKHLDFHARSASSNAWVDPRSPTQVLADKWEGDQGAVRRNAGPVGLALDPRG
jgi:hypothetical protein